MLAWIREVTQRAQLNTSICIVAFLLNREMADSVAHYLQYLWQENERPTIEEPITSAST